MLIGLLSGLATPLWAQKAGTLTQSFRDGGEVPVNLPPTLVSIGNQTVELGSTLGVVLNAKDPEGAPVTFSVKPLPLLGGASLDSATGQFVFTPSPSQVGTHILTLVASDGLGSDSETIEIEVTSQTGGGPTTLEGTVLASEDASPLVGVTVSIPSFGLTTTTDSDGSFVLASVPDTATFVQFDGSSASGGPYALVSEDVGLLLGHQIYSQQRNVIGRPTYLPLLGSPAGMIVPTEDTTLQCQTSKGMVELEIFANTATVNGQPYGGPVYLVEVAANRTPAALPLGLSPGLVMAIQPPGISFSSPARLEFPNFEGLASGNEQELWSIDAGTGLFAIAGTGTVTGNRIDTTSGGVQASSWHFFLAPVPNPSAPGSAGSGAVCEQTYVRSGSFTSVATGNLLETVSLPSYRRQERDLTQTLVYNSTLANPEPIVAADSTILQRSSVPQTVSASVQVGGLAVGAEVFTDTTSLDENLDETIRQSVQFDAGAFATGAYPYLLQLKSNFPGSSVSSFLSGTLVVDNRARSPFGAGWGLAGLQRLYSQSNGSVLLTDGDGSARVFSPTSGAGSMLVLDGVNDYAEIPSNLRNMGLTTAFSVMIWVNSSGGFQMLLEDGTQFNTSGFYLGVNPAASRIFARLNTTGGSVFNDNIPVPAFTGQWSHLAFTYDGTRLRVYFNGAPVYQPGISGTINNGNRNLRIGFPSGEQFYGGSVDELQIWDVSLTQAEVVAKMSGGLDASEPGLVGYWRLDEGSGQTISDSVGGRDGVRGSTPMIDVNDPAWGTSDAPIQCTTAFCEYLSPPGEFSALNRNADSTFTRTLHDGTSIHFDVEGRQDVVGDRNGNTTVYSYDSVGRIASIMDPTGAVTRFDYVGLRLQSITDPVGRSTFFRHDSVGNLIEVTDPLGHTRRFTYDSVHRLVSQQTERGYEFIYRYDHAGRHAGSDWPDGSSREIEALESLGVPDASQGLGTPLRPAPVVRSAELRGVFTDGNGGVTTYKTNQFGTATETVDPMLRTTLVERDSSNLPVGITRPNGSTVAMTYDSDGNLLSVSEEGLDGTSANDLITSFTYEPDFNQVASITDPKENSPTTITYDANGNAVEILDADGVITSLEYADPNCPGAVTRIVSALGLPEVSAVRFAYDPVTCNLVELTNPLLDVTRFSYDAAGNLCAILDAEGNRTALLYDSLNRVAKVVDATNLSADPPCGTNGVTCFEYDEAGSLLSVTDARSNATAFEYDSLGSLVRRIDPLLRSEAYSYDMNGNLRYAVDRKGQTIEYQYDAANRLCVKVVLPGPGESVSLYGYDLGDNLVSVVDPSSTLMMIYDQFERLVSVSTAGSPFQPDVVLAYGYDKNGNRTSMTDPAGQTLYTYDAMDRLTHLSCPGSGGIDFAYDGLSRRRSLLRESGVRTSYTYDEASQLMAVQHDYGVVPLSHFAYGYDRVGNPVSLDQVRSGVAVVPVLAYVYDELYRLTSATRSLSANPAETFQYDAVGNRLLRDGQSIPAVFDPSNRLLEDEAYCYSYDLNGNLIARQAKSAGACTPGGALTEYEYDPENRLRRVLSDGVEIARYRYDGLTRRVERVANGVSTRYVYDGEDIAAEFDGANTAQARYIHGPGIDEPLVVERGGSFAVLADSLGSVVDLVDPAGVIVGAFAYDAFGRLASSSGATVTSYSYAGRESDLESGLYHYRARSMDPSIGRFLQEDPLGISDGVNLYTYAGNNPMLFVDPSGLAAQRAGIGTVPAFALPLTNRIVERELRKKGVSFPVQFTRLRLLSGGGASGSLRIGDRSGPIEFVLRKDPFTLTLAGGPVQLDLGGRTLAFSGELTLNLRPLSPGNGGNFPCGNSSGLSALGDLGPFQPAVPLR